MNTKGKLPPADFFVGIGLIAALILAIVLGGSTELQTTIASGLVGFMGKAAIESREGADTNERNHDRRAE